MADNRRKLSPTERKRLDKQRKAAAKQAQKFHKEKNRQNKKSSDNINGSKSKIEHIVNTREKPNRQNISREEKFVREGKQKIRNLEPKDFDDGYYIDEYGERERQQRRAKEIHRQESEKIRRRKKPLTPKQVKRRRIVLYSAICLVVLIIGAVLSLTVLFKTEKIVVEGDKYYYDDQVIAFSGVSLQQNIFIAAMQSTPDKITENLPYAEKASVNFTIPDTITIKITDAVPSYVIKQDKDYLLVSAKGRILDTVSKNGDKLPELKCGKLKSTKVGEYVSFSDDNVPDIMEDISKSLSSNKVKSITGIDVSDTANIKLSYDGRITINIGLPEDIDYKIKTAVTIISEKLDPNNSGTISGTLDVSSCNTTKMSHYKPAQTTAPKSTTQPTTQPATQAAESADTGIAYTWSDTNANNGNTGTDTTQSGAANDGIYAAD